MNADAALKRILVIDDDGDFRKLLLAYLGKLLPGVAVEEYDPVARGVPAETFDWSRYDVLVLDYYLSTDNVTGLDILQANRRNRFFPAAIMLTGAGNEETAVRALKAGVYDYLRKEKLDKEQLRQAIVEAFDRHKAEMQRRHEFTQQSNAFNKALFYQQLEQPKDREGQCNRVLLLIQLNNHEMVEELMGIIFRDNIVRHMAKQSFEFFQTGGDNPNITRLSDHAVALLMDDPGSAEMLASRLAGVCDHLKNQPYRFEDRKVRFTVSIGAVAVPRQGQSAEPLIQRARAAAAIAAEKSGNSYHVIGAVTVAPSPPAEEATMPVPPVEQSLPSIQPAPAEAAAKQKATRAPQPAERMPPASPLATPAKTGAVEPPAAAEKHASPVPAEPVFPSPSALPAAVAPASFEEPGLAPQAGPTTAAAKAQAAPTEKALTPAAGDEAAGEPSVKPAALDIKKAFDEKRVQQIFQPVIPLVNTESDDDTATYWIHLQLVDTDGSLVAEDAIYANAVSPEFRRFIDRWLLRETLGRIVNSEQGKYFFILKISDASLADPSLFNWLRKTLTGLEARHPGRSLALEIACADFAAVKKKAEALMTYLQNSHGFRFVLGQVRSADELKSLGRIDGFQMVRIGARLLPGLRDHAVHADEEMPAIIVDGIQDATGLTDAIAGGAAYAMGPFIGESTGRLENTSNVESFEIA